MQKQNKRFSQILIYLKNFESYEDNCKHKYRYSKDNDTVVKSTDRAVKSCQVARKENC